MLLTGLAIDPAVFATETGWVAKPEGLCKGDACVPVPGAVGADGLLDVELVAGRLRMPLVHDEAHGVWALGPEADSPTLLTTELPDLTLTDRSGQPFSFASLRGRRVVMVAWASW